MQQLDPVIHQPLRLRIMAALTALEHEEWFHFVDLRKMLGATDGNLGAHLQKLEEKGYIEIEKKFLNKKPCTLVKVSDTGRVAFVAHARALKAILGA